MSQEAAMDLETTSQPTRTETPTTTTPTTTENPTSTTTTTQHVENAAQRRDSTTDSHHSTDTDGEWTTDDEQTRPVRTSRLPYWCHQCQTDITPMRAPHPICPTCNSEFVEEIEEENHPEDFGADGDTGDETDEYEDIYNELTDAARQANSRRGVGEMRFVLGGPGGIRIATENVVPGGDALMATFQNLLQTAAGGDGRFQAQFGPRPPPNPSGVQNNDPTGAQAAGGTAPAHTQTPNTTNPMAGENLLSALIRQALGEALQGGGVGAAAGIGGAGAPFNFSSFFNMVGNPGDYVLGQTGLDNIITALMEQQQSQNAPPPAPEQVINTLPRQKIGEVEVAAGYECAVCKDEYALDDVCIKLPCNHTFHDDCIRPWLQVNGTCPTCRYSLITSTTNSSTSQPAPTAPATASELPPQDPLD